MDNRPKIISAILTGVVTILLIVMLLTWTLNINLQKGQEWPPVKNFELIADDIEDPETFVSTYDSSADDVWEQEAEIDDTSASNVDSEVDTQTSYDLNNSGDTQGHHANVTDSNQPSPVEQKQVNEGVAKPDDAAKLEAERQQKSKKNIEDKVSGRWSGTGKGEGGKVAPKTDGNKNNNGPGGTDPINYSASHNERPSSNELGTIRIRVVVLEGGIVEKGSAQFITSQSNGNAAKNNATIEKCKKAAEKCVFKRASNDTKRREAIITFKWEDSNGK